VHRDELVVEFRGHEGEGARESDLQPEQIRQHQRYQPRPDRGNHVLDGDDFVVLAPDIFAHPGFGMVKFF
jgi:hypothetical protein